MPTKRPRHLITETDEVSRALVAAAKRWPDESGSRTKLLLRLLEEGHRTIDEQRQEAQNNRRSAIARTGGILTGAYGPNYLATLREEWPA